MISSVHATGHGWFTEGWYIIQHRWNLQKKQQEPPVGEPMRRLSGCKPAACTSSLRRHRPADFARSLCPVGCQSRLAHPSKDCTRQGRGGEHASGRRLERSRVNCGGGPCVVHVALVANIRKTAGSCIGLAASTALHFGCCPLGNRREHPHASNTFARSDRSQYVADGGGTSDASLWQIWRHCRPHSLFALFCFLSCEQR